MKRRLVPVLPRVTGLAGVLGLATGCMSLDFMFERHVKVDEYVLHDDVIPAENVEIVQFDRGDGVTLYGAWARQDPANPSPPLIYFHGNNSNIETNWDRVGWYWSWGKYDVFVVDYAGYGMSEGEVSRGGQAELDGQATVDYVHDTTGVPMEQIPWVALSIGGFVTLSANNDRPAQALILENVYGGPDLLLDTSLTLDVPPGWFFAEDWDTVEAMRGIQSPVFVVHGLADDFIPPASAELLYDAAPTEKDLWLPEGVNHDDIHEVMPDEAAERYVEWLERFEADAGTTDPGGSTG